MVLIKGLLAFDTKETVFELNGVKIEAFPSHHLDAMRGLPNVSFILLDEDDFFPPPPLLQTNTLLKIRKPSHL